MMNLPHDPLVLISVYGLMAVLIAGLLALTFMAQRRVRRRRQSRREACDPVTPRFAPSSLERRRRVCLEELARNAAEALVHEFPIHGADLLGWIAKHRLINQAEIDALLAAARAQAEREERAPAPTLKTSARHQPVDDEIPF